MSDFGKTAVAVVVAAGLAAAAYITRPTPITDTQFTERGEFFPGFTDPTSAKALQVLAYDEAAATIRPFRVEFDGTRWMIPSHHGYPADAQKNMGEAASVFIGLEKEQVVTDRAADHEALGVLSPDDAAAPLKGRGTRITLSGEGGSVLADLIIGKEVKSTTPDPSGAVVNRRYVRLPDKARVYAVNFSKTFSTAFADWVETDLLKLGSEQVNRVVVDKYEVDEQQGMKNPVEKITMSRGEPASSWQAEAEPGGGPIGGETVNSTRIEEMIGTLRSLKIAGVRPKPQRLADWFAGKTDKVTQLDVLDLQSKGFFTTQQGQFVGNQGEMSVSCGDGVVYTLYFGEVLFGEGDELSAGKDVIASGGGDVGPDKEKKGQESRYAFVNVRFDESLIPTPPAPVEPAPAAETPPPPAPETPAPGGAEQDEQPNAQPAAGAQESPPEKSPAQVDYERRLEERKSKVEAGKKRADSLSKRFAQWYYVIDAASFGKLRPSRADVISKPAPPEASPTPPPAMPMPPQ